jgi:hypothetical protein
MGAPEDIVSGLGFEQGIYGSLPDSAEEGSPLLFRTKGVATHPDLLGKEGEAEDWGKESFWAQ